MPATFVVGALYGDEGKGRVVDALAADADIVARFNGGGNARHTLIHRGRPLHLRQVPSGVLRPRVIALIGPGCFVQPLSLLEELAALAKLGVDVTGVRIAAAAALVLPHHVDLDVVMEQRRRADRVGTTRSGLGPAMIDKARRVALRVEDLLDRSRIEALLSARDLWERRRTGADARHRLVRQLVAAGKKLRPRIVDGSALLRGALARGDRVLFEGAQGALLDVDHGAWPHVTISHPTVAGALAAVGLPPKIGGHVVGVTRAYATRQAAGFFPTEVTGVEEGALRAATREHSLRIGWIDLPAIRWAHTLNGFDELVVTGLDRLSGLATVRLCTTWRDVRGEPLEARPPRGGQVRPVFAELPGFTADLHAITDARALPAAARRILDAIEEGAGVPVRRFSVAPSGPLARRALQRRRGRGTRSQTSNRKGKP